MTDLVSIVMPVFNRESFLEETLRSIENQTYSYWELIAVDDRSTDTSVQLIHQFAARNEGKCTLAYSAFTQSGAGACRNAGLKLARGKYVIFLDSDDLLAPRCLVQRIEIMNACPLLDWAVFFQYEWTFNQKGPYRLFNKPIQSKEEAIHHFLQMDPPWQTMAPIWKKEALVKLHGFDEDLIYMEDPDLHLRALLDKDLKVKIEIDLPPDCYYRISNMDKEKVNSFYYNSIINRFHFLSKVLNFLPAIASSGSIKEYYKYIRKGYFDFIKVFLLSRLKEHKNEFEEISESLFNAKILSSKDMLLIRCITRIFTSDSFIIKRLRIRGVVNKLL